MTTPSAGRAGENSRDSLAGAGWACPARDVKGLLDPTVRDKPPFRWLNPKTLIDSRNDLLAKAFGDPSPAQRQLWISDWYGAEARPPCASTGRT